MSHRLRFTCLVVTLLGTLSSTAWAAVVVQHTGLNDPGTEGWSSSAAVPPTGVTVGPLADDDGSGLDAWQIADNTGGGRYYYFQSPSSSEASTAMLTGWRLDVRLRVPDSGDTPDGSYINFSEPGTSGARDYFLDFGSDANGHLLIDLEGQPTVEVGSGGYHLVSMLYDPASPGVVDVYVDGVLAATDYSGRGKPSVFGTSSLIRFGAVSTPGVGTVNYNWLQMTTIPEPSSAAVFVLLSAAGGMVAGWRRRG